MTIMDTLYILFKGDTSDLDKKSKDAKKTVSDVSRSFMQLAGSFGNVITALTTTAGIVAGIKNASDYAQQLDLTARQMNVNVSTLDAYGSALKRTGGSVESFATSIKGLAGHLGVTNTTAIRLLPQIADAFERMGRVRSQQYGSMLGLDQSTILLLQQGSRAVGELVQRQKDLGLVSQHDAEIARKFNYALQDTEHAFRSVFLAVASSVLPILTKLGDILIPVAAFFRRHSDIITGSLYAVAIAAGVAAVAFGVLTSPITLLSLAVVGLGLAYDDLKTFFNGGDSLIGRAAKRWPEAFEKIRKGFVYLREGASWLASTFGDALNDYAEISGFAPKRGATMLAAASATPIGLSSGNIFNSPMSNAGDINIAEITINTQASDADGVAGALAKGIRDHIWQANSQFDNGIAT